MADIVTDISVNKNWQARKGYHNPFTFTFTNNASAFNISGYTFSLQVRRFGSTTNLINLTQGSGLTNGGATGVLTGQINAAATSSMSANEYYWQLTVVQPDTYSYVLFNGTFVLHDETYTGSLTSAVSVAVNLTGSDVDVTVTLVGGSSISFEDEGVSLGTAGTVDFVGAGVTATKSGDKVTVTIPGGAGVSGSGTTNQIAYWTGATSLGALTTATYPSLTELSYVKGITSSIQTQLDAKMPLSGTATFLGTLYIDADGYDFSVTNAGEISLAATTQISITSGLNYFNSSLNQFTGGNVGLDVGAYINWGTTYGSSGYGIRDNAGTMEFKNNAGSWTPFGSGGGGITIGTTTITSGTNTRILYNNSGVVGEYVISGSGNVAMTTNPVFTTPNLGTPSAATLTNATGLPISTGVSGLGTGVATFLGTPSWTNFNSMITGTAPYWALTGTSTFTGAVDIVGSASNTLRHTFNSLGTTQTNGAGLWMRNTTAAAAGSQQISPSLVLEGQGWKTNATAASQSVKFSMDVLPVQGAANPTGNFIIRSSINNAAYTSGNGLFLLTSGGDLNLLGGLTVTGAATAGRAIIFNGGAGELRADASSTIALRINAVTAQSSGYFRIYNINGNYANTSGENVVQGLEMPFAPTSGTGTMTGLKISGTINQTGGANGITKGVEVRPTHTSTNSFIAFDYNPVSGTPTTDLSFRSTQGNMLVAGSSYINFGTTSGSSGYGFRDNGGTIEFKNSGGAWTAL